MCKGHLPPEGHYLLGTPACPAVFYRPVWNRPALVIEDTCPFLGDRARTIESRKSLAKVAKFGRQFTFKEITNLFGEFL